MLAVDGEKRLADLVAAARDGRGEAERRVAEERLAAAVHALLLLSLRKHRVDTDAEDIAQEKVCGLVQCLMAGAATTGREEQYVWVAGKNAAIDDARRPYRRRLSSLTRDDGVERELPEGGSSLDQRHEVREQARWIAHLLRERGPPRAYKEVLRRLFLEEVPLDDLVREELARPGRSGAVRSEEQARNVVDQRISRARSWLRTRFADVLGEARDGEDP